jgi:hypothetical protein
MWLFASDDTLEQTQRYARAHHAYKEGGEAAQRREDLDDERELRAHARFRAFAWLLFGPSFVAAALGIVLFIVHLLRS